MTASQFNETEFVRSMVELVKLGIDGERERCAAVCEGWLNRFQADDIEYTSAREYAVDAINDILDLIRDGTDPREASAVSDDRTDANASTVVR